MDEKLIEVIYMSNETYMTLLTQPEPLIKQSSLFGISITIDDTLPLGTMQTNIDREDLTSVS